MCYYFDKSPSNAILPIMLSSPFAFCSLIDLEFLLQQTAQFHESIILLFFTFKSLGFYFLYFFTLEAI